MLTFQPIQSKFLVICSYSFFNYFSNIHRKCSFLLDSYFHLILCFKLVALQNMFCIRFVKCESMVHQDDLWNISLFIKWCFSDFQKIFLYSNIII